MHSFAHSAMHRVVALAHSGEPQRVRAVGGDDEFGCGVEEIGGHICLFVSVNLFFVVSCSASFRMFR